jgi:hypothetical protein
MLINLLFLSLLQLDVGPGHVDHGKYTCIINSMARILNLETVTMSVICMTDNLILCVQG